MQPVPKDPETEDWMDSLDTRESDLTYDEWADFVLNHVKIPAAISVGQFLFGELWAINPKLAEAVTWRSSCDPFEDDANVRRFLAYVHDMWLVELPEIEESDEADQ